MDGKLLEAVIWECVLIIDSVLKHHLAALWRGGGSRATSE